MSKPSSEVWPSLYEKMMSRVEVHESGCWLWTGAKSNGYGTISWDYGKTLLVHRVSYEFHKGPIPKGLFVMYSCDVRNCVNPDHLRAGTNQDNVRDMVAKGRDWPSLIQLSDDEIARVKRLLLEGRLTQMEIARRFATSQSNVSCIKLGKVGGHVEASGPFIERRYWAP
jgi:hypothetical protein